MIHKCVTAEFLLSNGKKILHLWKENLENGDGSANRIIQTNNNIINNNDNNNYNNNNSEQYK